MSDLPNPYDPSAIPEPDPAPGRARRFGRIPRAALAGGLLAGLALGGTGVGLAVASASSGPSANPETAAAASTTTTVPGRGSANHPGRFGPMFRPGGGGAFGFAFAGGLGGGVLHGEFTVRSGSGYKTEAVQTGSVTAVSKSSLTVKSSDGYTHTYVVESSTVVDSQAGGISSVSKGDSISVTATVSGSTETAAQITDQTKLKSSGQHFGFDPFGGGGGGQGPRPPAPPSGGSGSSSSGSSSPA